MSRIAAALGTFAAFLLLAMFLGVVCAAFLVAGLFKLIVDWIVRHL